MKGSGGGSECRESVFTAAVVGRLEGADVYLASIAAMARFEELHAESANRTHRVG